MATTKNEIKNYSTVLIIPQFLILTALFAIAAANSYKTAAKYDEEVTHVNDFHH